MYKHKMPNVSTGDQQTQNTTSVRLAPPCTRHMITQFSTNNFITILHSNSERKHFI